MHRRIAVIACVASLSLASPGTAYATPGALDDSFSGNGIVTTPMANSYATDVALDSTGRAYAVGEMDDDAGVVRYTRRGKLDTSFSGDGIATAGPAGSIGEAYAVAVDTSDRPVVVAAADPSDDRWAVLRFTVDGELDTSFSGDGIVRTQVGTQAAAYAVAIQEDGGVVVVGTGDEGGGKPFVVARYTRRGRLDTTFSGDGIARIGFSQDAEPWGVAIADDGRIAVAGNASGATYSSFALAMLKANGRPDPSFSGDGRVKTDWGADSQAWAVAFTGPGDVLAAGYAPGPTDRDASIARYKPNGSLDPTWGGDGLVQTDWAAGEDQILDLVLTGSKVLVAGYTADGGGQVVLARYRAAKGGLDDTFDGDGIVITDVSLGFDMAYGLVVSGDTATVAGDLNTSAGFFAARYMLT